MVGRDVPDCCKTWLKGWAPVRNSRVNRSMVRWPLVAVVVVVVAAMDRASDKIKRVWNGFGAWFKVPCNISLEAMV